LGEKQLRPASKSKGCSAANDCFFSFSKKILFSVNSDAHFSGVLAKPIGLGNNFEKLRAFETSHPLAVPI